ncbi:MAG: site-2 protease family protein [Chloroflexi bacterium]|nr:site-2 protease family protein [Chloroflexota bacterium]
MLPANLNTDQLSRAVQGFLTITSITWDAPSGAAVRICGQLLVPSHEAYRRLEPFAAQHGCVLRLRRDGDEACFELIPTAAAPARRRGWLPILLGVLTVLSVTASYLFFWEGYPAAGTQLAPSLAHALTFAGGLLGILLTHEFGHFLMARRLSMPVSWPYLIPFPLSPFGTLGAIIRMRGIPRNRRELVLIGVAGPLAGLVVAIPVLLTGLMLSSVETLPASGYILEGNSLLYTLAKLLVFGRWLPSAGSDVMLHPLAFAGWAGLLVTAMNLLPSGQLDGGHIAYGLLGRTSRYLAWAVWGILVVLGIWWRGWWLWVVLLFLTGRRYPAPLDEITTLTAPLRWLAIVMLIIFVLTFTPLPMILVN